MLASYEPNWKGAIDGMVTGGLVLALVGLALGAYASGHHPLKKVLVFLFSGFGLVNLAWTLHWLAPVENAFGWITYPRGDEQRWIAYFELRHFVVFSFFGLILGWLTLESSTLCGNKNQDV